MLEALLVMDSLDLVYREHPVGWAVAIERVEAEARKPLEEALAQIDRFAACHHGDQNPNEWLHGLLVDIPSMVESALAQREPAS